MALLKSLIQRLLDSRTTPEEAGHSAMPSASETVLLTQNDVYQSWGTIHQGVAADDGYVNIYARANNSDNAEMRVLTSNMTFSSGQTNNNMDMACSAPVAKGQSYSVKGVQVKAIKIIFVKALGAIGGGYNHLVRRALSCLRALSNCLPRSFCKANILTLPTSVGRVHILKRNTSQAMKEKILWLRSAVGRSLNLVPQLTTLGLGLRTLPGVLATLLTQSVTANGRPFQCRKATQSASILGQTTQTQQPSYSFATNRLNNLLSTGGALC